MVNIGVRKTKSSVYRRTHSGFAVSRHLIRKTETHIDPLMDKEGWKEERADPARFMTRKQRKEWRRLSPVKRRQYIRRAQREVHRDHARQGIALRKKVPAFSNRETAADPEIAKLLAGWMPGENGYGKTLPSLRRLRLRKEKELRRREQGQKNATTASVGNVRKTDPANGRGSMDRPDSGSSGRILTGQTSESMTGGGTSSSIAGSEGGTFADSEEVLSSSGPGMTVAAAKKTAERFNRELEGREQTIRSRKKKEAGKPEDSLSGSAKAGALIFGGLITGVIQAAVQLVSSIISILTVILVPLAVVALIISFTVSLLTGIGGAVDEASAWYMGGGMDLVEVAIREVGYQEGADGSNKYGAWAGIGNASWCHAFVSWCANECDYIEEGIIPKTASCEEGRQWFIGRNEYRERGSYDPVPGDIVYFRHGSETVSHHVGIVEYAENGILHTIEGNSGGAVKRREYPMTADRIMGYGMPAYPDDGVDEFGGSQEFLSKVKMIGQTILADGDWRYSNSNVSSNFEDARRSRPHKLNCSLGICFAMQEYGTLKKNQTFYPDWNGNIICNSAVRKRIDRYYDIINVDGKRNASGVSLKPGDICIWNIHVNVYAGEENGKKVWYDFSRNCVSDKKPESGTYVKYIRKGGIGQTLYKVLRLKDQSSYGSGKQTVIPKGLGDTYTYMGWAVIHDWPTRQNYLRQRSGEHYDKNGFAKVNGRYVIACTTTFGKVGDYIDFVLDNGKVIHAIMGDEKNQSDPGCNKWGHDDGHSVVEFVVNKSMWYGYLDNSDITRFHPEWKSRVRMGVNLGKNYFGK